MDLTDLKIIVGSKLDWVMEDLSELLEKSKDAEEFTKIATALARTVQARAVIKRFGEIDTEKCTRPEVC